MKQADRFKLRFGSYRTPAFQIGKWVQCEVCGEVQICGITDGRIPWPVHQNHGRRSLVVYKGLAKAVRLESQLAVRYWFGIGASTANKFRRALGVEQNNQGTLSLRTDHSKEPWAKRALKKAWSKARDPERRRKIAESKIGKPRPESVIEALRKANTGRKLSAEHRAKMSAAAKARKAWPPSAGKAWSKKEDWAAMNLTIAEAAERTGRTYGAVQCRRVVLRRLGRMR